MGLALVLHALKAVPFAPLVTTLQKIVILSFAAWLLFLSAKGAGLASRIVGAIFMCFPVLLAAFLFLRPNGCSVAELLRDASPDAADAPRDRPLTADELAGLAWLEHVTGTLDDKEEREWWDIGGTQHGIFSKRYNIAFAGYAAVAVGMRGDAEVRGRVGKVLANCFERMLRADVWEYSQTKSYRENVMYTGHLLHLLALYELFTGDRRYHREGGGWDFVWKDGRKVHYDVEKLIEVTVEQMRKGPNGGITCEPGLMFFPCNSHPHVALAIFRKLGYGDWSQDAARWEKWALSHYLSPAFGGGEINLVYHVRGNFMYPRGQDGLDGWSLLWYEAWASDRRTATALWRRVRERLDWSRLDSADDTLNIALRGPANLADTYTDSLYNSKISLAIGESKDFDVPVAITPEMMEPYSFVTTLITVQKDVVEQTIGTTEYKGTRYLSNLEYADFDLVQPMNMELQDVTVAANETAAIIFSMDLGDVFRGNDDTVTYAVDDLNIAQISGSKVLGVAEGTTKLYATHASTGATTESTITVTPATDEPDEPVTPYVPYVPSDDGGDETITVKVSGDEGSFIEGKVRIGGMISQVDNVNRILDRVALYLA